MPLAGAGFAVDRRDPHAPHQRRHMAPSDSMALAPEDIPEHPGAGKRILQMQFVNPAHQGQRLRRHRHGLVVDRGPGQLQQLALPPDW